jgi:hypothetical protein
VVGLIGGIGGEGADAKREELEGKGWKPAPAAVENKRPGAGSVGEAGGSRGAGLG